MPRRPSILVKDLEPDMIVPAHVHRCPMCEALFLASSDAKYCSNTCRANAGRAKNDRPSAGE